MRSNGKRVVSTLMQYVRGPQDSKADEKEMDKRHMRAYTRSSDSRRYGFTSLSLQPSKNLKRENLTENNPILSNETKLFGREIDPETRKLLVKVLLETEDGHKYRKGDEIIDSAIPQYSIIKDDGVLYILYDHFKPANETPKTIKELLTLLLTHEGEFKILPSKMLYFSDWNNNDPGTKEWTVQPNYGETAGKSDTPNPKLYENNNKERFLNMLRLEIHKAHQARIVHGDVKLDNICITFDSDGNLNSLTLVDFPSEQSLNSSESKKPSDNVREIIINYNKLYSLCAYFYERNGFTTLKESTTANDIMAIYLIKKRFDLPKDHSLTDFLNYLGITPEIQGRHTNRAFMAWRGSDSRMADLVDAWKYFLEIESIATKHYRQYPEQKLWRKDEDKECPPDDIKPSQE